MSVFLVNEIRLWWLTVINSDFTQNNINLMHLQPKLKLGFYKNFMSIEHGWTKDKVKKDVILLCYPIHSVGVIRIMSLNL